VHNRLDAGFGEVIETNLEALNEGSLGSVFDGDR
jgi:hypothetical protein